MRKQEHQINKLELNGKSEPKLSNYYKPSKEKEEYQMMAIAIAGLGGGFVGDKVYKGYRGWKNKHIVFFFIESYTRGCQVLTLKIYKFLFV